MTIDYKLGLEVLLIFSPDYNDTLFTLRMVRVGVLAMCLISSWDLVDTSVYFVLDDGSVAVFYYNNWSFFFNSSIWLPAVFLFWGLLFYDEPLLLEAAKN